MLRLVKKINKILFYSLFNLVGGEKLMLCLVKKTNKILFYSLFNLAGGEKLVLPPVEKNYRNHLLLSL